LGRRDIDEVIAKPAGILNVGKSVATYDGGLLTKFCGLKIIFDDLDGLMAGIQEKDRVRATAEGFNANRARATEKIEYVNIKHFISQNIKERFFYLVGDGTRGIARHSFEPFAFGTARNYP